MDVDLISEETQMSVDVCSVAVIAKPLDQEGNVESDKEAANLLETVAIWLAQYIQVRHLIFYC